MVSKSGYSEPPPFFFLLKVEPTHNLSKTPANTQYFVARSCVELTDCDQEREPIRFSNIFFCKNEACVNCETPNQSKSGYCEPPLFFFLLKVEPAHNLPMTYPKTPSNMQRFVARLCVELTDCDQKREPIMKLVSTVRHINISK